MPSMWRKYNWTCLALFVFTVNLLQEGFIPQTDFAPSFFMLFQHHIGIFPSYQLNSRFLASYFIWISVHLPFTWHLPGSPWTPPPALIPSMYLSSKTLRECHWVRTEMLKQRFKLMPAERNINREETEAGRAMIDGTDGSEQFLWGRSLSWWTGKGTKLTKSWKSRTIVALQRKNK